MSVIGEVNLLTHHEARWRFLYRGHALPGGTSILTVTDGFQRWHFQCRSEGKVMLKKSQRRSISGALASIIYKSNQITMLKVVFTIDQFVESKKCQ
ncbi:hypothetical protein Gotur_021015 [Gossypium turneri]